MRSSYFAVNQPQALACVQKQGTGLPAKYAADVLQMFPDVV